MQKILIKMLAVTLLAGCAYQPEVQQGNVVTEEQLARLATGMTSQEVRIVLGAPLLQDPFHGSRWDYYYSRTQGDLLHNRYRVTLFFDSDRLSRIEKSGQPPEHQYPFERSEGTN